VFAFALGAVAAAFAFLIEPLGSMLDWDDMNTDEKLEALRRDLARLVAAVHAVTSDVDEMWGAVQGTTPEVAKISKEVATLKSLWPYTRKHSGTA
jgi:hypothetical protein